MLPPFFNICAEPYHEYADILRQNTKAKSDQLFSVQQFDWQQSINHFNKQSIDSVLILDVIEHLEKDQGEKLLKQTEELASKQIVIFTPLGFIEQHVLEGGKDAWGLNGADWQEHKSGWMPEDFDDSWQIIACKDFHSHNNIGEALDEPVGAFWAIKTNKDTPVTDQIRSDDIIYTLFKDAVRDSLENDVAKLKLENTALKEKYSALEKRYDALEKTKAVRIMRKFQKVIGA